jgi:hypothetical protein
VSAQGLMPSCQNAIASDSSTTPQQTDRPINTHTAVVPEKTADDREGRGHPQPVLGAHMGHKSRYGTPEAWQPQEGPANTRALQERWQ